MIVVTPFTTKLLTSEADAFQVQFITYATGQALTGLFFRLAFADLRRSGLLRTDTPPEAVADTLAWVTAMIVTFVVSIPVALVTHWASLCWALLPLTRKALDRIGRKAEGGAAG
jgi:hypothetical protein